MAPIPNSDGNNHTGTSPMRSPPSTKTSRSNINAALIAKGVAPLPLSKDPAALLDSLDHRYQKSLQSQSNAQSNQQQTNANEEPKEFDPIDFLNQHYETEASLSQQLPALRDSVSRRRAKLNDRISHALQRQSETAAQTQKHVLTAKAATVELQNRILQIQSKAAASEKAVLEITKDMKRLDCAKQSLSRTITTLKRLHMLVHAVEQLRQTATSSHNSNQHNQQQPDYRTASHLVDAVQQLFQHFDTYTVKVQPMRILSNKVQEYKQQLRLSVVTGFRLVQGIQQDQDPELLQQQHVSPLTPEQMQGGVLLIDSLDCRKQFIHEFNSDMLGDYLKEFEPPSKQSAETKPPEKRISSFKKVVEEAVEPANASKAGLDHIEKRYNWFLNGPLAIVKQKFPGVFPPQWNLQASLANMFLTLVSVHSLRRCRCCCFAVVSNRSLTHYPFLLN